MLRRVGGCVGRCSRLSGKGIQLERKFVLRSGNVRGFTGTTRSLSGAAVESLANPICTTSPSVKYWMAGGAALVYGIIMVGGITRLTESGLSMVDWKFQGRLPPSNDEEWEAEFEKYKQYPEFRKLFPSMTVEEFKRIFFWEYLHRMWGRAIGLYVALPFMFYTATGALRGPLLVRSSMIVGGVGFQGLLGWWMVKSGLEEPQKQTDQPRVSQYRLSAHLGTALLLYSGMFWTALDLFSPRAIPMQQALTEIPANMSRFKAFRRYAKGLAGLGKMIRSVHESLRLLTLYFCS